MRGQLQKHENEENGQVLPDRPVTENGTQSQIVDGRLTRIGDSNVADVEWIKEHKSLVVKILTEILECEGSFDRLMVIDTLHCITFLPYTLANCTKYCSISFKDPFCVLSPLCVFSHTLEQEVKN